MLEPFVGIAVPRALAHAVQAVHLHLFSPILVIRSHHAALTGANVFGNIEAEDGHVAKIAHLLPLIFRLNGVCGVADNQQAVFFAMDMTASISQGLLQSGRVRLPLSVFVIFSR